MALFGWICLLVLCVSATFFIIAGVWLSLKFSEKRGDMVLLIICAIVIAACWYKLFGSFPYELTAK